MQSQKQEVSSKSVTSSTVPFVDTHCHIDYILQKTKSATFEDFIKVLSYVFFSNVNQRNKLPNNFDGAISIYCDPAALSPSFGTWRDQLAHPKIYGAFGIHPHNVSCATVSPNIFRLNTTLHQ